MNSDINNNQDNTDKTEEKVSKKSESSFKRKLKYGSVAMIFTVAFVAVMFVLNVVTTAINNVSPMMMDMTKEQIYEITDAAREYLKDITEPIEIVFFMPKDKYEKTVSFGKMTVNMINLFASEFNNITITEVDLIKTPGIKNEFTASELSQLSQSSIAVRSQGKAKLLGASAFFSIAQSTGQYWAFDGERALTAAILQAVDLDSPKAYFTTGHGESYPAEILELFDKNGFLIEAIDLSQKNLPDDVKILVISNPVKDFIGADPNNPTVKSEIDKVASFLNNFGSVMYFSAPESPPLPELDDLLKEYGIEFEHGAKIRDERNAVDVDGFYLGADYFVANNVGDELHASIRKSPSLPRTIVPDAKPIKILNIASERAVSPVLTSSPSSYVIYSDGSQSNQGVNNLLVVAQKTRYVDNNPQTSLLLVSGSYNFLGYLPNQAYANSDILLNAMRIMTNKKIVVDLKFKLFDSQALNMNLEQQNRWTLICIFLLPALVGITGVVVWLRRRHS